MKINKGFTLIELMVSMAIGLILLSTLVTFWVALSKNAHQEIIKLGVSQDGAEAVEYLRATLGRAIYEPACLNPEWLIGAKMDDSAFSKLLFKSKGLVVHKSASEHGDVSMMQNASMQFPSLLLGDYRLRTLVDSDLVEMIYLTPLSVVNDQIINAEDIRGSRVGTVLVTDCRTYLLGEYERYGDDYSIAQQFSREINQSLSDVQHHQYYKVNRLLIYVSYEQGAHFLIYNFMDGSNFIRFASIQGLKVDFEPDDYNLLKIQLLIEGYGSTVSTDRQFHVRLLNL